MKSKITGFLFFVLLIPGIALAAPSIYGSTGMINNPSADVLREGKFSIGSYGWDGGNTKVFNIGLADKVELGLADFDIRGQQRRTYVNAKFGLLGEKVLLPGFVIGIEDAAGVDKRSVYAVTSKSLPFGYRIHLGAGTGRFDGIYAGLEKKFKCGPTLIAEYDGRQMNYGARLTLDRGLKLDAGWRNDGMYAGLTFTR